MSDERETWTETDRLNVEQILGDRADLAQRILGVLEPRLRLAQLCHDLDGVAIREYRGEIDRLRQIENERWHLAAREKAALAERDEAVAELQRGTQRVEWGCRQTWVDRTEPIDALASSEPEARLWATFAETSSSGKAGHVSTSVLRRTVTTSEWEEVD